MGTRIAGIGKALPERVLTNADLEKIVDTSDEWITERTGIKERRIAADHETAATLDAADIDLVVCATVSPDGMFPATASLIQDALGARNAGAFDVNAACVG